MHWLFLIFQNIPGCFNRC